MSYWNESYVVVRNPGESTTSAFRRAEAALNRVGGDVSKIGRPLPTERTPIDVFIVGTPPCSKRPGNAR